MNWLETIKAGPREQLSSLANFSSTRTHRRTLDKFLDIFHTRNMVKRPGLGKRKRVILPPIEASEENLNSLNSQKATQDSQTQGRFKKRLVRMTDGQEDEMAEWLKNHPEMYNKAKKEYRDTDRKEAAWATQARAMGMEGELD